jgi:hypothetical protein
MASLSHPVHDTASAEEISPQIDVLSEVIE